MSRPKNADGQRTRQAILQQALHLFAEHGFFGTSLRDIAKGVGVRESAIYNYFASKDALFDALITTDHEAKAEKYAALLGGPIGDAKQTLEKLAEAMLTGFARTEQEQLFRILLTDGVRLARSGRINLLDRMGNDGGGPVHELLRRLIRAGVLRNSDLKMLVITFVAPLILWRHVRAISSEHPLVQDPSAFARQHVDQFLSGAAAPRASARHGARRTRSSRRPTAPPSPRRRTS